MLQVVLTDCEEAVLLNLRECTAANASDEENRHALPSAAGSAFPSQVSLSMAAAVRPLQPLPHLFASVWRSGEYCEPFQLALLHHMSPQPGDCTESLL